MNPFSTIRREPQFSGGLAACSEQSPKSDPVLNGFQAGSGQGPADGGDLANSVSCLVENKLTNAKSRLSLPDHKANTGGSLTGAAPLSKPMTEQEHNRFPRGRW